MHIRKTFVLMAAILLLAAGLFLVDQNSQAIASPSAAVSTKLDAAASSGVCNVGTTTTGYSFETAQALNGNPNGWKIDPVLLQRLQTEGQQGFYVILTEQADLSKAAEQGSKDARTAYVLEQLTSTANKTQPALWGYLDAQGVEYRSMYIQNMIRVKAAGLEEVLALAARKDVAKIDLLPETYMDPVWKSLTDEQKVEAIEWNITRIGAPDAWAMGFNGDGYVVASHDTGVDYTHPALVEKYRGNEGGSFDHNYNWWDGLSGYDYPHDYDGHGTHTTGTMVGDDGVGNQIGVAPGAQWIACPGIAGVPDTIECFEFFLAPWDLNGQNADPSMAPDSINNSWYDTSGFDFRPIIQTLNAAGVAVIKSAGNWGSGCETISPPGNVPEIIATAAFGQGDIIADFSSRGPDSTYGETILKPEVAAPGVDVRSSVPGGGYEGGWSGTSMAAPHTTALVTILWQAAPCIAGDVPTTKQILMDTAEAKIDAQCSPFVGHPNDVWGWGVLDAEAAVQAAIAMCGGQGALDGTVTESVGGAPLEAVEITAARDDGYTRHATTDITGYYTTTTSFGTYTVTAELFGYYPGIASGVEVVTDTLTTQDFVLDPLPLGSIFGVVTDGPSGLPLEATIEVLDAPIAPVTSDPSTGEYTLIDLPYGDYTLKVSAPLHSPEERLVTVDGDVEQNFALAPLPCILLVDDDVNNPDVQADYTTALDNAGLEYAVWDTSTDGDPTVDDLLGYNMVIWFTGYPYSNTFNDANEAAVGAYLDAGGNFLLSSQDYLYDMGLTTFGTTYLHIASFTSDVSQTSVTGANPFAGLGPYSLSYDFTNYSDTVNPDASGVVAFTGNVGNAAVAYDGAGFNTIFLGFPFEAINTLAQRTEAIQAAVDFMGGCACVPVYDADFTFDPAEPLVGEDIDFSGTAGGNQPIGFEWDFGDGVTGAGAAVTHAYAEAGTFTVVMTATNACGFDIATHDVTAIIPPPAIALSPLSYAVTLFSGESTDLVQLIGNEGGSPLTFTITENPEADWLTLYVMGGEVPAGETLSDTVSFDSGDLPVGIYTTTLDVSSNDPIYPLLSLPVEMEIVDIPVVDLTAANDGPHYVGEATTLSSTIEAGTNVVFTWDFGDETTGEGAVITHTYAAAGIYTATVTATNSENSLTETTVVTIEEEPQPDVYIVTLPLVTKTGAPAAAPAPSGMLREARFEM